MSPTELDPQAIEELEGHYQQALSLTKGLLSEVRAHGREIDLESLAQRIKEREKAIRRAALALKAAYPQKDKGRPECRSIRRIAQETHDLGQELACLLARIRDDSRQELEGYGTGSKLMKGYKGFKAKVARRLDRQV